MKSLLLGLLIIGTSAIQAQHKKAYQLFDSEGKTVTYNQMLDSFNGMDVIFFGEQHNNPIIHWLQLELTQDLLKEKGEDLIISAEMFESDNQVIVDEYMQGFITEARFEAECRLWPNYETDYKPLLELAKDSSLTFVASNVPRRYANIVSKKGFEGLDTLSVEAKSFLPPLPIKYDPELGCYKKMMEMEGMPAHMTENLPKAQALKDATMAYFIDKYFRNGSQLIHYVGSFHTDNHEGIVWYLKNHSPQYRIKVISSVEQESIDELDEENIGLGDFILVVPENMTKTY